jgi:5'-3' exonuclease
MEQFTEWRLEQRRKEISAESARCTTLLFGFGSDSLFDDGRLTEIATLLNRRAACEFLLTVTEREELSMHAESRRQHEQRESEKRRQAERRHRRAELQGTLDSFLKEETKYSELLKTATERLANHLNSYSRKTGEGQTLVDVCHEQSEREYRRLVENAQGNLNLTRTKKAEVEERLALLGED